jgi:hypothetical protein
MRRVVERVFPWRLAALAAAVAVALAGPAPAAAGEKQDTEWEGVSVELISVKRTPGNTITMQFKYANAGSKEANIARLGQFSHDNMINHIYYVDTKNNKKYLAVTDAEKKALGTNLTYFTLAPGASKTAWAKFPAPPAGVDKITVYLPGAPPYEDVPVQ